MELKQITSWFKSNRLTLNIKKTKWMLMGSTRKTNSTPELEIKINGDTLERVSSYKYLGVILDSSLSFTDHLDEVCSKMSQRLGLLRRLRPYLCTGVANLLYKTLALPLLEYCNVVWDNCSAANKQRLQILQNRGARIILRREPRSNVGELHQALGWSLLQERRTRQICIMVYKCLHGLAPNYLLNTFRLNNQIHSHNTRQAQLLHKPNNTSRAGQRTFAYRAAEIYNTLKPETKQATTLKAFKQSLIL